MNNYEDLISQKLSKIIKQKRIKQKLSQKELAEGICSQGMISSIEHGDYIPNTAIFLAICSKLNFSIDQSFLKDKLSFSNNNVLSDTTFNLCRKHNYTQLIKYLTQPCTIASLNTDVDFQTYYYYYGCSVYQVEHDLLSCQHYFELALKYTIDISNPTPRNSIELLLLNSLAVIYFKLERKKEASELFKIVNAYLSAIKDSNSENLNVIQYHQGMVYFDLKKYNTALKLFLLGMERITKVNSTFMLSNYSTLILKCYQNIE